MNIEVKPIFPTYIAHGHISDHEIVTRELAHVMSGVPEENLNKRFDLWDYCTEEHQTLAKFKNVLCAIVGNINDQVEVNSRSRFEVSRSWCVQVNGHYDPPHHHSQSKWVSVYYASAPEGCGDLLLLDPRGGVYAEQIEENGLTNRAFKRITPKTGDLIIFPGYLIHMVEPSNCAEPRVVMASLFREIYA